MAPSGYKGVIQSIRIGLRLLYIENSNHTTSKRANPAKVGDAKSPAYSSGTEPG